MGELKRPFWMRLGTPVTSPPAISAVGFGRKTDRETARDRQRQTETETERRKKGGIWGWSGGQT